MYFPNRKKVVNNGQVLNWVMKFDGMEDLEVPITIEIAIGKLPNGSFGLTLGPKSNLPETAEVVSLIRPHQLHHAKLYWIKGDTMALEYGEHYLIFVVEEVFADSATLYFHAYLPKEFGGGDMVYTSTQHLEST